MFILNFGKNLYDLTSKKAINFTLQFCVIYRGITVTMKSAFTNFPWKSVKISHSNREFREPMFNIQCCI